MARLTVMLVWSLVAMLTGCVLDMLLGDPRGFPHIVRWMGGLISALEGLLRRAFPSDSRGQRAGGAILVCIVLLVCAGAPSIALFLAYGFSPALGYAAESLLCWQLLAAKSLKAESMKVCESLMSGDLHAARRNVSMIVGRDTAALDREGVARAAVETVAENATDAVAAPLLYIALGGAALGCLYKAGNTMDSMLGYKNERYIHFGRAAAKTDDCMNIVPARLCALLMIAAAFLLGLDCKNAARIWRRDKLKHASPNSAQTEAVCAGALGIRLAGPASYFGKPVHKPTIGDAIRPIRADDIAQANRLMLCAGGLTLILAIVFRLGVICIASL